MKRFSLSSLDPLPGSVRENGRDYPVNTDFRVILRIFRMLNDPEIADGDRLPLLGRMFYRAGVPAAAGAGFEWFIRCGREEAEPGGERDFDYEQDAAEMYSAFMQVYGFDLTEMESLHWWRFLPLLEGLFCGENALSAKIRLRHADDGPGRREADFERKKRAVRLREARSRAERAMDEELRRRLMRGGPVEDLLGREKD